MSLGLPNMRAMLANGDCVGSAECSTATSFWGKYIGSRSGPEANDQHPDPPVPAHQKIG
jgi:hypothetical protein